MIGDLVAAVGEIGDEAPGDGTFQQIAPADAEVLERLEADDIGVAGRQRSRLAWYGRALPVVR